MGKLGTQEVQFQKSMGISKYYLYRLLKNTWENVLKGNIIFLVVNPLDGALLNRYVFL